MKTTTLDIVNFIRTVVDELVTHPRPVDDLRRLIDQKDNVIAFLQAPVDLLCATRRDLKSLLDTAEGGLVPKVSFTGDMEEMRREAEEEARRALSVIRGSLLASLNGRPAL